MNELAEIVTNWTQWGKAASGILLIAAVLGIAAYRLSYRRQVDSNGKVVVTRKLHVPLKRLVSMDIKSGKKAKPFSRMQKRFLRMVYSMHEAFFGLIIFAFGLGLITKVFFKLIDGSQSLMEPATIGLALLGILAMPIGVLLIYFRNVYNPFDDT